MVAFYAIDEKTKRKKYIIGLNSNDIKKLIEKKTIQFGGKPLQTDKDFIIYCRDKNKDLFEVVKNGIDENTQFTLNEDIDV
jgi:hypothetical protein